MQDEIKSVQVSEMTPIQGYRLKEMAETLEKENITDFELKKQNKFIYALKVILMGYYKCYESINGFTTIKERYKSLKKSVQIIEKVFKIESEKK